MDNKAFSFNKASDVAVTFDCELLLCTLRMLSICKRTLVQCKESVPDAVLWNPWDKKAKAFPDLGDEDYKTMLCVDSAAIETPIVLQPFEEWKGGQEFSTLSSSYCSGQLDPWKVLLAIS
ncbi:hypothetical protein F0562_024941 [Nyssa sinensis]|uniref:ZP domain-containing protein n=1 Tax=Nyssa sinensis TaxID=561372 RepID=A0A5J5BIH3_9ASTE|nr:hypothetical protein F0562_024941 [Nyssa sinensis]